MAEVYEYCIHTSRISQLLIYLRFNRNVFYIMVRIMQGKKLIMLTKKFRRRHFVRSLVLLGSFLPARVLLALPLEKQQSAEALSAIPAFLDTLIPADVSPSASQLNVGPDLITAARQQSGFERLLILGCAWLNEQAQKQGQKQQKKKFENLDESSQIAIVKLAEQSADRSLPRVFFNAVQHYAFGIYYAHPETWVSLGYTGPPQPVGFPDHAKPPGLARV